MNLIGKLIWSLIFGLFAIIMMVAIIMLYFYPPYRVIASLFRPDETIWHFIFWMAITLFVWFGNA